MFLSSPSSLSVEFGEDDGMVYEAAASELLQDGQVSWKKESTMGTGM